MRKLHLTVLLPVDASTEQQTLRHITNNVVSGQGVVITMPDGFTFDMILLGVEHP